MPYKVKGKCIYKKDTNEKVGCTKGSVKKYLAALHANVNEDLDWIKEADTYRGDYVIKRRSGRHTYITVTDEYSHGPNNQPAVKYYIGDRLPVLALSPSQGSMLISTLQEKIDNGQWERLGTFTEPRTSAYDSMLGESEFDWTKNVDSMRLLPVEELEDGKLYTFNINQDVVDTVGNVPKWVYDYQGQVIKVVKNNLKRNIDSEGSITFIPYGNISRIKYKPNSDSVTLSHKVQMFVYGLFSEVHDEQLTESFDWTEDVPANMTPGKQYYVKQPSGIWTAVEYCGEGETEHPDTGEKIMGHRFKDIDSRTGKCNEWWSNESLKYKIDNNLIREYDSEWTILDDVEFGTLNDIEGRNFVIYFENGIDIGDTVELQKRLFDMGYHFPNRGDEFKPVTNEDTNSKKIIMFECYNWDTSNERYRRMPSDYRDKGIMLMVADKKEEDSFFRSDKERQLQNRFSTVIDHNAVVVNGYDYLDNTVNESSDFDWVDTVSDDPIRWKRPKVTLDNVERDVDDWPVHYGDGEGEVWIDFEKYTNQERIEIFHNIEKHLGTELVIDSGSARESRDVKILMCTANNKKGLLLHCGHEENHFFSQENHVCCMPETYQEFKEYEEENGYMPFRDRPIVDGGIFLDKTSTMNEGFYYKGVNPTVDLIVIRGDKVLLIKRGDDAEAEPGKWALPGGFHDTNAKKGEEWRNDKESALEAAKREVKEETGLDVDRINGLNFQLVGVFEGGGRDPRDKEDSWTRSTVYMVHIPESEGDDVRGMDDAQRAEWVPLSLVLQRKLAFDHHKIIEKAIKMNESDAFNNLKDLLTENFEWTEDIPDEIDFDLWEKVSGDIDNEVSGPWGGNIRDRFGGLAEVLDNYNIDIEDMGEFFMAPPDGVRDKNGNHITNHQLRELHQDLIDLGISLTPEQERDLNLESVNESDFEWAEDIKPSWLRIGQKFTNINNLRLSRQFEPKDKVQVGSLTFEIYDINEKDGQQYLRFTHNDVMAGRDWERKKEEEIGKSYRGINFTQAKQNIDKGWWIPLTDCEFIESNHPNLVGKTKPDGSPYGHVYCLPDTSFEHMSNIKESNDFDWANEVGDDEMNKFFNYVSDNTDRYEYFQRYGGLYLKLHEGQWPKINVYSKYDKTGTYPKFSILQGVSPFNIDGIIKDIESKIWYAESREVNLGRDESSNLQALRTVLGLAKEFKIKFINEDFDWVQDAPDYDAYRFFDVYTCGDNQYDEETGEDECLDGGSYFLRIPKEEAEEIWDLDIDDMGGPGDEGLGVIQWAQYNAKIDPDDYAMVEYVREIDRVEFCHAARHWNEDICGGLGFNDFVNESNDFEWTDEVKGKPQVMDIFRVKNTRYTWTVVEELTGDRFLFKIRPKPDSGSDYQELSLDVVNHWLQTGNWVPEGREKYRYNLLR